MRDADQPPRSERPSRSTRRRAALDVFALARRLSTLPSARLDALGLPEDVRRELAEAQRTPSHIAHKRQLGHLAKCMRGHADEEFAKARAILLDDRTEAAREAAALHRVETLRENLLGDDGDAALASLLSAHPHTDHQALRALVRKARRERAANKPPRAQRELFRFLRDAAPA